MPEWIIYVVVGLVVGLNFGYIIGIRRGTVIVGELLHGFFDGIVGAVTKNGKDNGSGT